MKKEVADQQVASSARAAPATNGSNKWPAAALSSAGGGIVVAMSAMSLLFAWQATRTLRRCGAMDDEDEVLPGVLWGLSLLISAYLLSWTVALSPAAPRAAGGAVAPGVCLLIVAAAADFIAGPVAGAAASVLATLYSACACGRAVAERRQRAGTERWSAAAAASAVVYRSRAEEREERQSKVTAVFAMAVMTVAVAAAVLHEWWTSPTEWEVPAETVAVFFFLAGPLLLAGRLMLPGMVGSPVLAAVDDMRALAAVIGVVGWLVAAALYGTIAGTVVVWIGELGMLGFLGYFLAVEAHHKQHMAIERRKPRRAKDDSGLLDGRDSYDSCSAHIDATAGICVDCVLPRRCNFSCRSQNAKL